MAKPAARQTLKRRTPRPVDSIYEAGEQVGDAWSWLILREATLQGVGRFNSFQRRLGIARETLASRLAQLVQGDLLQRGAADDGSPDPYVLTERGRDFFPCLALAFRWGHDWCSPGSGALSATHRDCGAPFQPELRCARCEAVIDARDVLIDSIARASSELIASTRQRAPNLRLLERTGPCPIARTLQVIGDRWSSLVVRECFLGTRRFDEFRSRLGLATNILSNRLRRLVEDGVLVKQRYQTKPPRDEYRLTPKGIALYPVPLSLLAWGDRWLTTGGGGIRLTHRPCGHSLAPALCCGNCARPARLDEVAFTDPQRQAGLASPSVSP